MWLGMCGKLCVRCNTSEVVKGWPLICDERSRKSVTKETTLHAHTDMREGEHKETTNPQTHETAQHCFVLYSHSWSELLRNAQQKNKHGRPLDKILNLPSSKLSGIWSWRQVQRTTHPALWQELKQHLQMNEWDIQNIFVIFSFKLFLSDGVSLWCNACELSNVNSSLMAMTNTSKKRCAVWINVNIHTYI